jgi:hypothetical protein
MYISDISDFLLEKCTFSILLVIKFPVSSYFDFIFLSVFEATLTTTRVEGVLFPLLGIGFGSITSNSTQIPQLNFYKVSDGWYPSNCIEFQ